MCIDGHHGQALQTATAKHCRPLPTDYFDHHGQTLQIVANDMGKRVQQMAYLQR